MTGKGKDNQKGKDGHEQFDGERRACCGNGSWRVCWWEGPDGSRILLGFCPNYGEVRDRPIFRVPEGWKHKTYLAYYMRGDNRGPISPKEAETLVENVRKAIPGVKVRFGDPSEFADAIIAEEKANPTLPVIRGDMPDTWIHGLMSEPEGGNEGSELIDTVELIQ